MRDIRILHYWLHDSGGVKWLNPSYYDNFIRRTNSYSIAKTAGDRIRSIILRGLQQDIGLFTCLKWRSF